jgi:biopolymer transport protein ExbD
LCGLHLQRRDEDYAMAAKVGGGGGGRYALGQNADINVTPFVDIMLVLLIVMMVAVPVATLAIKVDLPPATVTNTKPKLPTYIDVDATGHLNIYNPDRGFQAVTLQTLSGGLLTDLGPGARDESILIKANRATRYSDFMAVVNQLQVEGFYKVSLITESAPGAGA